MLSIKKERYILHVFLLYAVYKEKPPEVRESVLHPLGKSTKLYREIKLREGLTAYDILKNHGLIKGFEVI
jgi:hypothetical protein